MTTDVQRSATGAFVAESPWIRRAVRAKPSLRLICFPYAGSGASLFRSWSALLPPSIEVIAVQLPGREDRSRERRPHDAAALARCCALALRPYCTTRFALYGHCAGALLAYEVAGELGERFAHWPDRLVAAAQAPPDAGTAGTRLHELPDDEFLAAVRALGGLPDAVDHAPELLGFLLPLIRADFALWERYERRARRPVRSRITALVGRDDDLVTRELATGWRAHTDAGCTVHEVGGGHYFLDTNREETTRVLADVLLAD